MKCFPDHPSLFERKMLIFYARVLSGRSFLHVCAFPFSFGKKRSPLMTFQLKGRSFSGARAYSLPPQRSQPQVIWYEIRRFLPAPRSSYEKGEFTSPRDSTYQNSPQRRQDFSQCPRGRKGERFTEDVPPRFLPRKDFWRADKSLRVSFRWFIS